MQQNRQWLSGKFNTEIMKMKYTLIALIALFVTTSIRAQIGINTETITGLFNVSGSFANTTVTDDLIVDVDSSNKEVVLGLGAKPIDQAQVYLSNSKKAFIPNKVALTSSLDVITVPSPTEGMLVFNTNVTTGNNRVQKGLYEFVGGKWQYWFLSSYIGGKVNRIDLKTNHVTAQGSSTQFGTAADNMAFDDIVIKEAGAYAFSFRLYGAISLAPGGHFETNGYDRGTFYIWLMKGNGNTPVDVAEMNPVLYQNTTTTYSVVLGGQFEVDDIVKIRLFTCPVANWTFIWTLYARPIVEGADPHADRTSLIYWKL